MDDVQNGPKHACPVCGRKATWGGTYTCWECFHGLPAWPKMGYLRGPENDITGTQWDAMVESLRPLPGTWAWACAMILQGEKVRRAAWSEGIFVKKDANSMSGWTMLHTNGTAEIYYTICENAMSATDWEIYHG